MTAEFLANVELRKIYCLVDLKRYEAAKALCEHPRMRETYAEQLDMERLYDYCFCYASILGHLGQIPEMDREMTIAHRIAAEHLGELEKCERALMAILQFGKAHQAWKYLWEQSQFVHRFGLNNGSDLLQWVAGEFAFYALRGLGKKREARKGGQKILKRYQDAQVLEKVAEWEALLESVR